MNIEMILSDQHKKENEDIIKELKIQNTLIENKLQQISIFYITNNDTDNYELTKTFIVNLYDFIEKITDMQFNKSENYILYLSTIKNINDNPQNKDLIMQQQNKAKQLLYSICNEEQDKLINIMLINEKKLKIYENLLEMYLNANCDCENEDDLEIKPEQNISVITNIIFLIMILFIIIIIMTTVFLINQNHQQNHHQNHLQYNNKQCRQIQIMNKQNKLDDFI
jgi:hypothetical protein